MDSFSDFNEQDPQSDNTLPVPLENKLPLYLSQFALHLYSIDEDYDQDDESYDSVKVLSILKTLKTLDDEHGTTCYVDFEASLPEDSGNPQIFETNFFVYPGPNYKDKDEVCQDQGQLITDQQSFASAPWAANPAMPPSVPSADQNQQTTYG